KLLVALLPPCASWCDPSHAVIPEIRLMPDGSETLGMGGNPFQPLRAPTRRGCLMSGCGALLNRVRPSARTRTPQRALYAALSAVGALWSAFGAYHWGRRPARLSAPERVPPWWACSS